MFSAILKKSHARFYNFLKKQHLKTIMKRSFPNVNTVVHKSLYLPLQWLDVRYFSMLAVSSSNVMLVVISEGLCEDYI